MTEIETSCDPQQCREIGERCAVLNLRKAARLMTRLYEETMKPAGLLPTQFSLMVAIRAMDPVRMSQLAVVLAMDRTTLTRNLRPLERQGLVTTGPVAEDRRTREVRLTPEGQARLALALPLWRQAQTRVAERLGEARLSRLLADLQAVATTFLPE